jgi:hypothetical protein
MFTTQAFENVPCAAIKDQGLLWVIGNLFHVYFAIVLYEAPKQLFIDKDDVDIFLFVLSCWLMMLLGTPVLPFFILGIHLYVVYTEDEMKIFFMASRIDEFKIMAALEGDDA